MSIERPSMGILVFQCDACYDTHDFNKTDGDNVGDFFECWRTLKEEGWSIHNDPKKGNSPGATSAEHFCADCTQIAKTDRANPFKR